MSVFKYAIFLTLNILLSIATMAHAQSSKASGFGSFDLQSEKKPWSYSRGKATDGGRVERFELRSGDCAGTDCKHDRERIEFIQNRAPKQGTEVWVGYSVFLDSSWPKLGRKMYTKLGNGTCQNGKEKGKG